MDLGTPGSCIVERLLGRWPGLLAIYALGSRPAGCGRSGSDLDAAQRRARRIDEPLVERPRRMVGDRNIAVHDDQPLQLAITIAP
jgi:hypothetical protein